MSGRRGRTLPHILFTGKQKQPTHSRPDTSFSHSQVVPESAIAPLAEAPTMPTIPFGAPPADMRTSGSRNGSISPESVFGANDAQQTSHRPQVVNIRNDGSTSVRYTPEAVDDNPTSYDLKPPPPSASMTNMESLSQRFFSADHLNVILRDQTMSHQFSKFIHQYKPSYTPILKEYMETQKVVAAVEYANAVADQLQPRTGQQAYAAAILDEAFDARAQDMVEDLVTEALPAYVTHRLVHIATDNLVKEITGQGTPLMREMIPSLAEVYCVTDPSLPDNPIVYASEEFYNVSQYGKEYVIGRNCRFLQGPKTSNVSVKRLIEALAAGQEITETILNYRRDGSPFMNLLMIAPLYDNKGTVRYFLGCQIDVSPLIEAGRGLDSFGRLLSKDRADSRFGGRNERKPAEILQDLGAMFDDDEMSSMKNTANRYAQEPGRSSPSVAARGSHRGGRRILGMDDDRALWPHPSLGPSGRLPGVYQNYLLVRPYPSLRITFTSPALRIPGLLQTKFLERVGGPDHVREGIMDALAHGTSVTAKITWTSNPITEGRRGSIEGKPRWIHCTPLLGSDEKVGVWMIIMVENEEVTGQLNRGIANMQVQDRGVIGSPRSPRPVTGGGAADARFTSDKLYQEYLRREGKAEGGIVPSRHGSARDPVTGAAPELFKDF